LLLVAVAWLVRLRTAHRFRRGLLALFGVGVATLAAGAGVQALNGDAFSESVGVRPMIAGLLPIIGDGNTIEALTISALAVAASALVFACSYVTRRGAALALLGIVFVVAAGIRTHRAINLRLNSWEPTTQVVAIDRIVPPGEPVGVKFVPDAEYPKVGWDDQRRRMQLYQFSLPDRIVLRDRGLDDDVGPYVFAPLDDPDLERAGARVVWRDPRMQYALWREPDKPDGSAA
jgi:hypothetical protein